MHPVWVRPQVWALVARVLGVIVMVPKAQALAPKKRNKRPRTKTTCLRAR